MCPARFVLPHAFLFLLTDETLDLGALAVNCDLEKEATLSPTRVWRCVSLMRYENERAESVKGFGPLSTQMVIATWSRGSSKLAAFPCQKVNVAPTWRILGNRIRLGRR